MKEVVTNGIAIRLNNNILENSVREGGAGSQVSTSSFTFPSDGMWHHIALTYNSGIVIMYLDGVPSSTLNTGFGQLASHSSNHSFGRSDGDSYGVSGNYYAGLMDEIIHYPSVLNQSEIIILADELGDYDNDGIPNNLDLDSDNDGCFDTNEAYGTSSTDSNGDGTYGGIVGTGEVNADGTVIGASYSTPVNLDSGLGDILLDYIQPSLAITGINTQPTDNLNVPLGSTQIYTIVAATSGTGTEISYQWQVDSGTGFVDLADSGIYSGTSTSTLTLTNISPLHDNYEFRVQISTPGYVCDTDFTSNAALLTIQIIDTDSDGVADFYDLDKDNDGILDDLEMSCDPVAGYDGYWPLENSTNDFSGNNHDLFSGSVTYSSLSKRGIASASFNGISNYLRYSDGVFLNQAISYFSYAFWIKPSSLSGLQTLLDEGGSVNSIGIRLNGNSLEGAVREGSVQYNSSSHTFPNDGKWHHVAITYNFGTFILYLDGIPSTAINTGFGELAVHSDTHSFGSTYGTDAFGTSTGSYYSGLMDDIIHYPSVLSSSDITDIINGTCDNDNDGTINSLDLDSDGDGCSDANEAYNDLNTDGGDDGAYGVGIPAVDSDGKVIDAAYTSPTTTSGGQYTFLQGVSVSVTTAPTDQDICETTDVTFTALATATILPTTPVTTASTNVTYQWQLSSDGGVNFADIVGETGTVASGTTVSLTGTNIPIAFNGSLIKVVFHNEANICGAESVAQLLVRPLPVATFSYTGNPYCPNASNPAPTFSGGGIAGNFTSTAGLVFVSAATGQVNISASTPGTYVITNTIAATTSCIEIIATSPFTILDSQSWTGSVNSDWNVTENWSCGLIPDLTINVQIPDVANEPILSSGLSGKAKDLIIDNGSTLTINGNSLELAGELTNNADAASFILQSDASGTASLIHNTNNVTATVQRYISGVAEDWHFLSSPVSNQSISGDWIPSGTYGNGSGYDLYVWNEPTFCWIYQLDITSDNNWNMVHPSANFMVGRGYLYSVQALNPTKNFVGNLNNGSLSYSLTTSASDLSLKGFNLIGNPYPSSIDWKSSSGWTRSNLVNSKHGYDIWIWNPAANNYGVCNSFSFFTTNGVSQYIAPMQGFFVQAATAGNLSMDNNIRVLNTSNWFKSQGQEDQDLSIIVKSEGNYGSDEIILSFGYLENENGAKKLFSNSALAPSLYLGEENNYLTVRYLTNTDENQTIPVHFKSGIDGHYTISCKFEANQFDTIMLRDLVTDDTHDLRLNNTYRFQSTTSDISDRFKLHFGSYNNYSENDFPARIYTNGEQLIVDLNLVSKQTQLLVYNIMGVLLLDQELESGILHKINLNVELQVLIVTLTNPDGGMQQKLVWRL